MMKKAMITIAAAALTMSLTVPVFASANIKIKANPTDEFRHPGETALFIAEADSYDKLEWIFVDPNGNGYTIEQMKEMFPNLKLNGTDDTNFFIGNLPEELNQWKVFCRFTKGEETEETDAAAIHVREYVPQAVETSAAKKEENHEQTVNYTEDEDMYAEPPIDDAYDWYDEDGNRNRCIYQGGVVTTEYYNGDSRIEYPDGLMVYESADGTVRQYEEDGSFQVFDTEGGWYAYDAATDTESWGNYYDN